MKKQAGLIALSATLVAGGCALLPHTGIAPKPQAAGISGPVTINIANLNDVISREGQTIKSNGTAKQIEVKVYSGDSRYTDGSTAGAAMWKAFSMYPDVSPVDKVTPLVATGSVSSAGVGTVTLPAIPTGAHVIRVNVFSTAADMSSTTTGADSSSAPDYLIAQGETYVSPVVGAPVSISMNIWATFAKTANLLTSTRTSATASTYISGVSTTGGLFIRMANWNGYTQLASTSDNANYPQDYERVRLSIVSPTAFSTSLASTSDNAGYFQIGDLRSALGFSATTSFETASGSSGTDIWKWTSDRKIIFTDIDLRDATSSRGYYTDFLSTTAAASGSLSIYLPAALVPSGYKVYLTAFASGSSVVNGSTTF